MCAHERMYRRVISCDSSKVKLGVPLTFLQRENMFSIPCLKRTEKHAASFTAAAVHLRRLALPFVYHEECFAGQPFVFGRWVPARGSTATLRWVVGSRAHLYRIFTTHLISYERSTSGMFVAIHVPRCS